MKIIKNTLALLFLLVYTSSCTTPPYYGEEMNMRASGLVYRQVDLTLRSYIETFDFARKIDAYLQAEGQKRDSIKYYTLSGYDILETQDSVLVKDKSGKEWRIHRVSTDSLNSEGAELNIIQHNRYNQIDGSVYSHEVVGEESSFRIINYGIRDHWSIKVENYNLGALSKASINIGIRPNITLHGRDTLSITTKIGSLSEITAYPGFDKFTASYQIIEPLNYCDHDYSSSGVLYIKVDRGRDYDVDNIKVKVFSNGSSEITYKGFTDIYWGY